MSAIFQLLQHAKKARAVLQRGRKSEGKKDRSLRQSLFPSSVSSTSVIDKADIVPTSSPWDLLPVELQIKIFAQCGIRDLLQLKLVCRAFCQILTLHEQLIARQYLRQRRHGTLPSPIDSERMYTRNPEDDVVLLSDLFPPATSAKGGHLYTFRYIHSLRRRQKLCSQLCYYLADRVMDRFLHCEPTFVKSKFSNRNERNEFLKRGKESLWYNLIPLMYYALYFLEAYSLARRDLKNALLQELEAGRLPVPMAPDIRKSMYRDLQLQILQAPPFTNTSTLICTHHCMQLLVSYLRHTVPPDEFVVSDDSWIGSLLTVSPFIRIVEYFSAEIGDGGSQRVQRKDFMHNFQNDLTLNENDDINSLVFESAPLSHIHSSVQDIWFDVAKEELGSRGAVPHDTENIWIWNGVPVALGCQHCRDGRGWRA
ncbi:F-box protein [Aspergillus clavatus NRRL 1]|uniref:F-box domain protein n=1 Tax=Aspergillus clavatus (strain ATCC 1007 / CBS 513.65 / DSM 816 / NCTC 3887 / NRRL 1 / QM 1276 / 107) TaxID=344612 RepID=A1CLC4_ASPCL|nr:F-box domain protein [Aspergillus clavatus NRRL 1]EAW09948.1 F-box domain protein [Aspergillus clavatus NRRL 1]